MDTYKKTSKKKLDRADRIEKSIGIYINSQINLPVILPITSIGNNLVDNIKTYLSNKIEGRCIVDGYIKPNSIDNIAYSSGICQGSNIKFNVVFFQYLSPRTTLAGKNDFFVKKHDRHRFKCNNAEW